MANLIGRWNLNGTIDDISGNGRHGALLGTPSISTSEGIIKSECYEFNSVGKYCILPSEFLPYGSDWSVSFFVKFNSAQVSYYSPIRHLAGGYLFFTDSSQNCYLKSSADNTQVCFLYGLTINRWYHVCFRSSNNKVDIFLDGVNTVSNYSTPNADTSVGRDFYVGSYAENNNTRFQDFRVYDGLLSNKEIHQISKALCLHYTFDDVEEPTVNLATSSHGIASTGNGLTFAEVASDQIGWKKYGINGTWTGGSYPYSITLESFSFKVNTKLSIQAKFKTNVPHKFLGNFGLIMVNDPNMVNSGISSHIVTDDGIYVKREGILYSSSHTSNQVFVFSNPVVGQVFDHTKDFIYIKDIQFEEKDHATPFVNGTRDNIIVRDKSDYGNDSLPLTTVTTPAFVEDCKIGIQGSKNLNNTLNRYVDTGFNLYGKTAFSISTWIKQEKDNSVIIGDHDHGNSYESVRVGTGEIAISGNSSVSLRSGMTTTDIFPLNQWSHFVFTYDYSRRVGNLYKNGVLVKTMTILDNSIPYNSGRTLKIFRETGIEPNTSQQAFKGNLDDLRIYATALTPEDIKEIYQSRANLDDKGNLSVALLNQQGVASISLTEKGVYNTVEISEVGVTEGLIAHYPLNGDARDYSGNGNDGTVVGATVAAGLGQKCYSFDGVDDKITTPLTRQSLGTTYSITVWSNFQGLASDNYRAIIGGQEAATEFFLGKNVGNLNLGWQDGDYFDNVGKNQVVISAFKSYVITREGNFGKIYVDGGLISNVTFTTSCNGTEQINIGLESEGGIYYWKGLIQDVRIYNRTLTPEEVLINYNLTKADKTAMIQAENGTTYVSQIKEG